MTPIISKSASRRRHHPHPGVSGRLASILFESPDVAAHLKVSRSLLNLRFRELQHASVYETILAQRLEEVQRRLRQTREPLDTLAVACGWTNPTALKNLFKRRFGLSMSAWRAQNAS